MEERLNGNILSKQGGVMRLNTACNADMLKTLAMAIMLIDHIGAFLLQQSDPAYWPVRSVGRLAFPIFCYLLAEGAYYTRSMPKYLANLALFALISTPPYNLVHGSPWYSPDNVNVFFTLFLGLAAVYSISGLPQGVFRRLGKEKWAENRAACVVFGLPLCAFCYYAAYWMGTDYGEYGVAAILLFWLLRKRPADAWIGFTLLTFVFFCFFIAVRNESGGVEYIRINLHNVATNLVNNPDAELYYFKQRQMYAPLAFIPCLLYNGKRGDKRGKCVKYLFYAFYPLHLWCLWFVQLCTK
ncbi:MAG: hypothetical protein IJM51_10110 [Clostridia bacterium]|nr:hypothetical protein [Clostridia bacterium]